MFTETGLVWLGFASLSAGTMMIGMAIGYFREYRKTKDESAFRLAVIEAFVGFILATVVTKLLFWQTPVGAFLRF